MPLLSSVWCRKWQYLLITLCRGFLQTIFWLIPADWQKLRSEGDNICYTAPGLSQSVPLGHISSSYGNTLRQTLENAKISFMATQGNLSLFVQWNIGFAESMLMSPERVVSGLMLDMGAHQIRESKIIMVILSWNLQHPHQSNLNNMGDRMSDGNDCRTWVGWKLAKHVV